MSRQRSEARNHRKGLMERPPAGSGKNVREEWLDSLREMLGPDLALSRSGRDGLERQRAVQSLRTLLARIARSDARLWEVVGALDLDPDERAMVMQAVAPHLMEGKPRSVRRGHKHATE